MFNGRSAKSSSEANHLLAYAKSLWWIFNCILISYASLRECDNLILKATIDLVEYDNAIFETLLWKTHQLLATHIYHFVRINIARKVVNSSQSLKESERILRQKCIHRYHQHNLICIICNSNSKSSDDKSFSMTSWNLHYNILMKNVGDKSNEGYYYLLPIVKSI